MSLTPAPSHTKRKDSPFMILEDDLIHAKLSLSPSRKNRDGHFRSPTCVSPLAANSFLCKENASKNGSPSADVVASSSVTKGGSASPLSPSLKKLNTVAERRESLQNQPILHQLSRQLQQQGSSSNTVLATPICSGNRVDSTANVRIKATTLTGRNPTASDEIAVSQAIENAMLMRRERLRKLAMEEILTTERTYNRQLQLLLENYEGPLRATAIISEKDCDTLFSSLPRVKEASDQLLHKMEERLIGESKKTIIDSTVMATSSRPGSLLSAYDPEKTIISDIFLTQLPLSVDAYASYCQQYSSAHQLAVQLEANNSDFRLFLLRGKRRSASSNTVLSPIKSPASVNKGYVSPFQMQSAAEGSGFYDYLILPIQRIPRYQLLLSALSKETPTSHADSAGLERAILRIIDINQQIDRRLKHSENMRRVVEMRELFCVYSPDRPMDDSWVGSKRSDDSIYRNPPQRIATADGRLMPKERLDRIINPRRTLIKSAVMDGYIHFLGCQESFDIHSSIPSPPPIHDLDITPAPLTSPKKKKMSQRLSSTSATDPIVLLPSPQNIRKSLRVRSNTIRSGNQFQERDQIDVKKLSALRALETEGRDGDFFERQTERNSNVAQTNVSSLLASSISSPLSSQQVDHAAALSGKKRRRKEDDTAGPSTLSSSSLHFRLVVDKEEALKKRTIYWLFLFNDILVVATHNCAPPGSSSKIIAKTLKVERNQPSPASLLIQYVLPLETVFLQDLHGKQTFFSMSSTLTNPSTSLSTLKPVSNNCFPFQLTSLKVGFTFTVNIRAERAGWARAINAAIGELETAKPLARSLRSRLSMARYNPILETTEHQLPSSAPNLMGRRRMLAAAGGLCSIFPQNNDDPLFYYLEEEFEQPTVSSDIVRQLNASCQSKEEQPVICKKKKRGIKSSTDHELLEEDRDGEDSFNLSNGTNRVRKALSHFLVSPRKLFSPSSSLSSSLGAQSQSLTDNHQSIGATESSSKRSSGKMTPLKAMSAFLPKLSSSSSSSSSSSFSPSPSVSASPFSPTSLQAQEASQQPLSKKRRMMQRAWSTLRGFGRVNHGIAGDSTLLFDSPVSDQPSRTLDDSIQSMTPNDTGKTEGELVAKSLRFKEGSSLRGGAKGQHRAIPQDLFSQVKESSTDDDLPSVFVTCQQSRKPSQRHDELHYVTPARVSRSVSSTRVRSSPQARSGERKTPTMRVALFKNQRHSPKTTSPTNSSTKSPTLFLSGKSRGLSPYCSPISEVSFDSPGHTPPPSHEKDSLFSPLEGDDIF